MSKTFQFKSSSNIMPKYL